MDQYLEAIRKTISGRYIIIMTKEQATQKIIKFLNNRLMAVSKKSLEEVLTLCDEHGITLEEVLNYWHEQALNV